MINLDQSQAILENKNLAIGGVFGYPTPMQLRTTISKILVFVVVSGTLLLTWNGGDISVSTSGSSNNFLGANTAANSSVILIDSVWNHISNGFALDHKSQSSEVRTEIRKLLSDQVKLQEILKAAGPYIYFIHKQTQAKGLPAEIALIPVIESEFNPNDRSSKGAAGLWQLMPQTARELGVKIKSGYDGRRNVVASTNAALAYFKDLGHNFKGNWYLAIAAYNCGEVRIKSAQKRTGSSSFWNLPLPRETRYYVPKLLAVAEIVKNPEKYGVRLPAIVNKPYFTEVNVKKPVNLAQVAKTSGVSITTLNKLNPDYQHGTAKKMLVPIDKVPALKKL